MNFQTYITIIYYQYAQLRWHQSYLDSISAILTPLFCIKKTKKGSRLVLPLKNKETKRTTKTTSKSKHTHTHKQWYESLFVQHKTMGALIVISNTALAQKNKILFCLGPPWICGVRAPLIELYSYYLLGKGGYVFGSVG